MNYESYFARAREATSRDRIPLIDSNPCQIDVPEFPVEPQHLMDALHLEARLSEGDRLPAKLLALSAVCELLKRLEIEDLHPDDTLSLDEERREELKGWSRRKLSEVCDWPPEPEEISETRVLAWELDCAVLSRDHVRMGRLMDRAEDLALLLHEKRLLLEGTLLLLSASPTITSLPVALRAAAFTDETHFRFLLDAHMGDDVERVIRASPTLSDVCELVRQARLKLGEGLHRCPVEPDSIYRCSLGLCEFMLGDHLGAAQAWERCIREPSSRCAQDEIFPSVGTTPSGSSSAAEWKVRLARPVALAYEKAGETARAIESLRQLTSDHPRKGDFAWLARLYSMKADYRTAYESILREMNEFDPSLGEDPVISTLAALTGATGLPSLDDYFKRLNQREPVKAQKETIRKVLEGIWDAYARLDETAADCFVEGLHWSRVSGLAHDANNRAVYAIGMLGDAVKRELHVRIFRPFRESLTEQIRSSANMLRDSRYADLRDFVLGQGSIDLGGMLWLLGVQQGEAVTTALYAFVGERFPKDLKSPQFDAIRQFRNAAAHRFEADGVPNDLTLEEAGEMLQLCYRFLTLLHSKPEGGQGRPSVPGPPNRRR